ncbi:hypothetical protein HELRODRAFT_175086 [Helobdella robusta]|uniref:Uncharacterized protein n=1 Tax=Helobdella robusta TaxID=6412 RepID=T1F8U1_HELRO|nr:hypothetical protein HELRODRAFT_175086 [Helobdella robusta]ESO01059.1 hypothetical protein HELRODRAFT_175086 [Helobdella robusta]
MKGQECPGSFKAADQPPAGSSASARPPLIAAPVIKPHVATRGSSASVSESPSQVDSFHVFDRLTVVLRTAHLYDHVPKPCRDKVSKALSALLTAVCDDPCDAAHWCRLQCFFAFVLFKPTRGGRRTNQANYVIKRLAEFSSTEVEIIVASFNTDHNTKPRKHNPNSWISAVTTRIEQGSLSAAVRLACSPAGLAESSPETLAKLKAIHPSAPLNRRAFPAQEPSNGRVSPAQVLTALKSFNNGSSGGLDGLRPQHIKDLLSGLTPTDELLNNLTRFALERVSLLPVHDALTIIRGALSLLKLMYFLRTSNFVNAAILGKFEGALRVALSAICNEPSGIAAHDGKRPDGCTLIPWRAGRASDEKIRKYDGALPSMEFLPICIEVLGPMDRKICKNISIRSGDSREYFFAMNNISYILQRFLRACVLENVELNADGLSELKFALGRVSCLSAHDALTIIRNALSSPKLMYFLRTSKHIDPSKLGEFDGALRTALSSICNVQEPSGISAHDGRRPDGCTLIPWRAGRCLAWDVTVLGTLAERFVNLTSKECGLAAAGAADEKMKKYGNALPSMKFLPICIEVLGPMDPNTLKFFKAICKMISVRSGDSRELFFATNQISCLLQRFLRVCVLENIQLNADMCN